MLKIAQISCQTIETCERNVDAKFAALLWLGRSIKARSQWYLNSNLKNGVILSNSIGYMLIYIRNLV